MLDPRPDAERSVRRFERIRVIKWVVVALLAVWLLYMFVSYAGA